MRFIWAVVAFVLAALMIGTGIAQRTVFIGPKTETEAISVSSTAPYVLIDGSVLNSHDGAQTLRVQEDGTIFAAYGRTTDLQAWLERSDYTRVTLRDGEISTRQVAAKQEAPEDSEPLSPVGSDLWLDQFQDEDLLITPMQLPDRMSLLVATDGIEPAPQSISLTWPVGSPTPWAGPLMVAGSLLLALGLVLYGLGVRHARRARGPRRKGLPLAATQPIDVSIEAADKGVISATPPRRRLTRGRGAFVAVPFVAVSALLLSGCSADAWPQFAPSPTPSASETVIMPEGQGTPAVTPSQAERIVAEIARTVADADANLDAELAATRVGGDELAVRTTNYTLRAALPDFAALPAIPSGPIEVLLPEAFDGWPRTFMAVVAGEADAPETVMMVTQADPWSDYKVHYMADLIADASLNLAPEYVGALGVAPDNPFLVLAPDMLATAYADVLDKGEESTYAALFESDDPFAVQLRDDRQRRLTEFNQTGSTTGTMTFQTTPGEQPPLAFATLDSGAIVAVTVFDGETVAPTSTDAVIKADTNPVVQTLSGSAQSATGFTTRYADQIFVFVPAGSSPDRIKVLGYSSRVLDSKVASS